MDDDVEKRKCKAQVAPPSPAVPTSANDGDTAGDSPVSANLESPASAGHNSPTPNDNKANAESDTAERRKEVDLKEKSVAVEPAKTVEHCVPLTPVEQRPAKSATSGSAINITISNGEIRSVNPGLSSLTTTAASQLGRAIAPKPVTVAAKGTPILEAIGTAITKSLGELSTDTRSPTTSTLLFASNTGNQSQAVIGTTSSNTSGTVKLANKGIPMALVPTSDGSQMIAVPLSGLNTSRGKTQVITIPVQISGSAASHYGIASKVKPTIAGGPIKAKMVINPSKLTTTVPNTGTTMATVLSSAVANSQSSASVAKVAASGTANSVTVSSTDSSEDSNKASKSNAAASKAPSVTTLSTTEHHSPQSPSTTLTMTSITTVNSESLSSSTSTTSLPSTLTPVSVTSSYSNDTKSTPIMPPKVTVTISGGSTQTNNESDNSESPVASTVTSVTVTMGTAVSSASNITLTSQQTGDNETVVVKSGTTDTDSQKTDLVTPSDFDPVNIMEWKDGIGTLPGSNLKFKVCEFGALEMVDDDEAEEVMKKHHVKNPEEKMRRSVTITANPSSPVSGTTNPTIQVFDPDEIRTCVNCGVKDIRANFIRQGKFCSQACATIQSTRLRSFSKHSSKDTNNTERKSLKTKLDSHSVQSTAHRPLKVRKISTEKEDTSSPNNSRPSTPSSLTQSNQSSVTLKSNQQETPIAWETRLRNFSKNSSVTLKDTNNAKRKTLKTKVEPSSNQNSAQRSVKTRKPSTEKSEKERSDNSPNTSRPSSPSSNHLSALHQSIFALRVNQQQQDAPVAWEKHSKNLLPLVDKVKPSEVLTWSPEKVSRFVASIPGCAEFGQAFLDELVDGEAFLLLNQPDLVKILGIKLGPAVKIYNSILVIRDNMNVEEM